MCGGDSNDRRRRSELRLRGHRALERTLRSVPAVVIGARDRVRSKTDLRCLLRGWPVGIVRRSWIVRVGVELWATGEGRRGPLEFSYETRVRGKGASVVHADDSKTF